MASMPLFELPNEPPLPRSKTLERGGRPVWARYKAKTRVACDECVIVLHENKGVGAYPRAARWSRTNREVTGLRGRVLLCQQHGEVWRKEDGK